MRVPIIRNLSVHIYANHTPPRAAPLPWLLDKQRTQPHEAFFYIALLAYLFAFLDQ